LRTFYELLAVEQTAGAEDIKRAFRREIARYHPDKVQHLGPEFQEIASTRAAELTEAYRVLMDPGARQAYDDSISDGQAPPRPPGTPRPEPAPRTADQPQPAASARPTPEPPGAHVSEAMRQTQATVSEFVRKATMGRLRDAVGTVFDSAELRPVRQFDAAFVLKPKRGVFQKQEPPIQLLVKIVGSVDGTSIAEAWPLALQAFGDDATPCLLLLGLGLAPARELAATIAGLRRRTRQLGPIVIPVDTRDWDALLPPDTPQGVRRLLDRLKLGA
jgi:DnaJ domain